jgi:hypothetical protein
MIIIAVDKQSSDRVIQGKQRGKSKKKNTSLKVDKIKIEKCSFIIIIYLIITNKNTLMI